MRRSLRVVALGALTAVLAVPALPATAQSVDTSAAADASAGVVHVQVPGTNLLDVAASSASLRDDAASAAAVPLSIADNPVGQQTAESTGARVASPTEGDGCMAPVDQLSGILSIGLVCGTAVADLDGGTAAANSGVGDVSALSLDLSAGQLSAIEDLLLGELGLAEQLDATLGATLRGLVDPLADECDVTLTGAVEDAPVLGDLPLVELTTVIDEVLGQVTGQLPVVCELLQTVVDLLAGESGILSTGSLSGILDGSAGVIELTLLETRSEVEADGTTVRADARPTGAVALSLNLPLGDALREGLEDILTSLTEGLLGQLGAPVFDELGLSPDDPAGDLAAQLLGTEGLSGLLTADELLSLSLVPGRAAVSVAQASGGASELVAEPAIVELGGALLDLPPLQTLESALNDALGQLDSALLATLRDTPLADLVSVTLLEAETDSAATVGGLPGATARSGAATVSLLAALEGGIQIELSPATAAAGAAQAEIPMTPEEEPDPQPDPDPLPRTGGGLALAGVLALAGAAGLRRRR